MGLISYFRMNSHSAEELASEARDAAEVRALLTQPAVVALRAEQVRRVVDLLFAVAVVLGLLFTMATVQQFAADGEPMFSLAWWTAWLLDPMFSLALIGVLIAEIVTARYQVDLGFWPAASKWFFLGAVLVMNTWAAVAAVHPAQIALHAAPVGLVFVVAQVAPAIRNKLTESVNRATEEATRVGDHQPTEVVAERVPVFEPFPVIAPMAPAPPPEVTPPAKTEELVVDNEMSPTEYLLAAWKFGRRVEAQELYERFPDKKKESLRSVMSVTRKKHPRLEPPVRTEEEVGHGQRSENVG